MKDIIKNWQKSRRIKWLIKWNYAKEMEFGELAGYCSGQGESECARTAMKESLSYRAEIQRLKKELEMIN